LIARALTRKNIFVIAVGVLLAGAPLLAFEFWVSGLIDRTGQEEVDTSGKRAIALAEARITQVIATLDNLAARGVDSCRLSDVMAMRQATFETAPIKEIAVVDPDGQTLCTDLGLPLGRRKVVSSEPLFGATDYTFDNIEMDEGGPMVRLRRKVGAGPKGVAALVPAFLFLPQVSSQGGPFHAYAQIATANRRFRSQDEIRQIWLRHRNFDAARSRDRRPRGVEVARHVRHRHHHYGRGRVLHADAAAHA